jgi:hypothetical protein
LRLRWRRAGHRRPGERAQKRSAVIFKPRVRNNTDDISHPMRETRLASRTAAGAPMQATSKMPSEIKDTFDRIDGNADQILEIEEFSVLMLEMDHRCSAAELRACFDAIDSDHDGRLTAGEFRAWLSRESAASQAVPAPGQRR